MAQGVIDGYTELVARLEAVRRRLRTVQVGAGFGYWLAASLGAAAAACVADNLLHLPAAVRLVALVGLVGAVAGGFVAFVVLPTIRRHSDDDMAVVVQKRFEGDLGNSLINAVQIARENGNHSRPFVDALVSESVRKAEACDFQHSVDRRGLRRGLVLAAVALLVAAGYAGLFPEHLANAGARLLNPYGDVTPIGIPRIAVQPGDCTIVAGENLPITVRIAAATLPESISLRYQTTKGRWEGRRLALGQEGRAAYTIRQVTKPMRYRVVLGEVESPVFEVRVTRRPALVGFKITYEYPKYTRLATRHVESSDGDVKAPVGTRVQLEVTTNKPIAACALAIEGGDPVPATVVGEKVGRIARAAFTVEKSATYQVRVTDREGLANASDRRFRITAVPDSPPAVKIASPGTDVTLTPGDTLKLALEASDDYGLGSVELRAVPQGADDRVLRQWQLPAPREDFMADHALDMGSLGVKPGDVLIYYARATDARTPDEPGVGHSARFKVTIVDNKTRQEQEVQRRRQGARDLKALLADQKFTRADCRRVRETVERAGLDLAAARTRVDGPIEWQTGIRSDAKAILARLKTDNSALVPGLEKLSAGPMVQAVDALENARGCRQLVGMAQGLGRADGIQTAIIDTLERMLSRSEQEESAAGVYDILKAFAALVTSQKKLLADTVAEKIPCKSLAQRQANLCAETGTARKMLGTTAEALKATSPELGTAFQDVAAMMDQRRVPEKMKKAAGMLAEENRPEAGLVEEAVVRDLEAVMAALTKALAESAKRSQKRLEEAMEKMARKARDMMELEKRIDAMTRDLDKKPEDRLTDEDRKKMEMMAELQSRLADAAEKSSKEAKILPKHEWSDEMAKCWSEVRKQCEASAEAMKKEPTTKVIPKNEKILEKLKETEEEADKNKKDAEGVLSDKPDRTKIKMENFDPEDLPLIKPGKVPEKIKDLVGNLVDKLEDQTEDVEDETSNWATKKSKSGLSVDGPMSSFGGKGQTGNRIPDPAEMTGRSGAGRSGKASGELIEGETKNIPGGKSPPQRRTNDPYQKGQVKDNNPDQASGGTGGGKKGGLGGEGLEGKRRDDQEEEDLKGLAQRQQQIRKTTQKLVNTFGLLNLPTGQLPEAVRCLKDVEDKLVAKHFEGVVQRQREALVTLKQTFRALAGSGTVEVIGRTMSKKLQKEMHDAIQRGFPPQYRSLLEQYYKDLSRAGQ